VALFGRNRDETGEDAGDENLKQEKPVAVAEPARAAAQAPRAPAAQQERGRGASGIHPGGEMANIGKSITIKGDLSGDEDLVIEGTVEGKIELPNNQLTVGGNGEVKADVAAKSVVIVGKVSGNVTGTERVEIDAQGVLDGDVKAPRLIVQEGAVLNGSVDMSGSKGASGAAPAPPQPIAKAAVSGGE